MDHASRRRFLAMAGSLPIAASAFGTQAFAQESGWPKRVITIVVGFPPGSINDVISRALAPVLSASLGQPVIVENKGGAGGTLGTRVVARAEPDGYTLMLGTSSQLVMNVPAYKKLDFSIENDLVPVALLARSKLMLVVHKSVPANNLKELIELAKAKPGVLNYGDNGIGGIVHISMERFLSDAKIKIEPVHYRGSGPALQAAVAGEVQVLFDGPLTAGPFIESGELKAIAISDSRAKSLPNVPTFKEQGLMNSDGYTWNSIMVPKGTPRAIIDRLNAEINKALETPAVANLIEKAGSTNLKGSTPEFDRCVLAQRAEDLGACRSGAEHYVSTEVAGQHAEQRFSARRRAQAERRSAPGLSHHRPHHHRHGPVCDADDGGFRRRHHQGRGAAQGRRDARHGARPQSGHGLAVLPAQSQQAQPGAGPEAAARPRRASAPGKERGCSDL